MHQRILLLFFVFFFAKANAQEFIGGLTADYNSGIGERYTYGIGAHLEARVWKTKNFYLNWHYAAGSNTHSEFYAHGGLALLMYKSEDWWDTNVNSWEELVGLVIGPAICPLGMTYYVANFHNNDYRFGLYCNPLALDYWNMSPHKVTSWTLETGAKFLWYVSDERVLYVSGGVSFCNNIRKGSNGYGDETLIGMQIGLLRYSD
jgi:hypothetical protein